MIMPFQIANIHRPGKSALIFTGVLFFDRLLKVCFQSIGASRENYGALFGYPIPPAISFFALILLAVSIVFFPGKSRKGDTFAVPSALILAGIVSNSIDRIWNGYVVDYIPISDLFTSNLADLAIACGAALFIWRIIEE